MKLSIRILLCAMAALMILALPFAVPSGSMLEEYRIPGRMRPGTAV